MSPVEDTAMSLLEFPLCFPFIPCVLEFIIFVGFTLPPPVMDKERETGTGRKKGKKCVIEACSNLSLWHCIIRNLH